MSLNTPAVHASTESYSQLNAFTPVSTLADTYLQPMDTPSYYSSASSNYSQSPAPISQLQNLPAAPEHVFGSRGPIIVPSATAPEPKPRRKGGRKPKNDPVSTISHTGNYINTMNHEINGQTMTTYDIVIKHLFYSIAKYLCFSLFLCSYHHIWRNAVDFAVFAIRRLHRSAEREDLLKLMSFFSR